MNKSDEINMDIVVTSSDEGNMENDESDGRSIESGQNNDYNMDDNNEEKDNELDLEQEEQQQQDSSNNNINNNENNQSQTFNKESAQMIERRSLRPSNQLKKIVYTNEISNDADSDNDVNMDHEDFNQQCLISCLPALKTYFYKRLEQVIIELGGKSENLQGYRIQILKRTGGLNIGIIDVFYYSTKNKRYRSRIEVACSLGLMVFMKNIRSMTREQHYINAIETREKHLLSQQLAVCNYKCDEIIYDNDLIEIIHRNSSPSKIADTQYNAVVANPPDDDDHTSHRPEQMTMVTQSSSSSTSTSPNKEYHLSIGNITVLDWGKITPLSSFHNSLQIYPIGFKCLRQEHDAVLDRVVDCYCEVVGAYEGNETQLIPANNPLFTSNTSLKGTNRNIVPIFRISIAWQIPKLPLRSDSVEDVIVRVYEGRTPQQAWQAAMLETIGISNPVSEQEDATAVDILTTTSTTDNDALVTTYDEPDEEENELRAKLCDRRRVYFRLIRGEQSVGAQSAMKPRFYIDPSESFMDELLLRLVEGMEGSISCHNYAYFDTREKEAGKKNALKAYAKLFTKSKNLDRVLRRNAYIVEQLQQLELKRRRNEEQQDQQRKRPRFDEKEIKNLTAQAVKYRSAKVKELEKNIYHLKYLVTKYVKRRRDDAKIMAELVSEREESVRCNKGKATLVKYEEKSSQEYALSSQSRPEYISNAIVIDGFVFGQLIEINEFLRTFSKLLDISEVPGIDYLVRLARVCDPSFKSIQSYTQGLQHTYDNTVMQQHLNPLPCESQVVFDSIGVTLTKQLIAEYERIHGLDQIEAQAGLFHIPVNALTWKEIARTIFLNTCCKELGIGENDISGLMKGRGYFTSPEALDRKTLKLAKRRIKFGYVTRDEHQESVYGFNSGVCVHIPSPGSPYPEEGILWTNLIGSLQQIPDYCGWLIFEIIKAAAVSVCVIDTTAAAKRLKRALLDCLCLTSFRINNGTFAKIRALQLLAIEENVTLQWKNNVNDDKYYQLTPTSNGIVSIISKNEIDSTNANNNNVDSSIVTSKDKFKYIYDQLKLVYDQTSYMIPMSTFDLWQKQLKESVRHANVKTKSDDTVIKSNITEGLEEIEEEPIEIYDNAESLTLPPPQPLLPMNEDHQSLDALSDDAISAEKLSVAMQRCYIVIRDLMANPQANAFLWPVDDRFLPTYYKFIPQPLSLSEVRSSLVEGNYHDSIFKFYCDVILVLENAMAFNPENSIVKISAQKLLIVFERLFFETVLYWENPLPYHDCCHGCRTGIPLEGSSKIVICDRCEAGYHLHCLEPPLQTTPRSEWYCIPCVEQKGIANAHPYKTADVLHPTDPDARGEVVGIEQMRQTVMFVVEFGSVRELWDGKKVRQYAIERSLLPSEEEEGGGSDEVIAYPCIVADAVADESSGTSIKKIESIVTDDKEVVVVSAYQMPAGYDYEDFDRVCGIARAYVGWGASHYLVPPVIMDEHNINAKMKASTDITFQQYRSTVAALGPSVGGVMSDELSMNEWTHVLTTLMRKVFDSSLMSTELLEIEEKVDDDLIAQLQEGVETQSLPLAKIFQFLRGEGLVKRIVKDNTVTPPLVFNNTTTANSNIKRLNYKNISSKSKRGSNGSSAPVADSEDEDDEEEDEEEEDEDEVESINPKEIEEDKDADNGSEEDFNIDVNRLSTTTSPEVVEGEDMNHNQLHEDDDDGELEFYDEMGNCLTSCADNNSSIYENILDNNTIINPTTTVNGIVPVVELISSSPNNSKSTTTTTTTIMEGMHTPKATSVVTTIPKKKESQKDWVKRLLSRKKGREDAYLIKLLLQDIITDLDLDGKTFIEEIGGSDFYPIALSSVIKICTNRPGATIAEDDWFIGWDTKFNTLLCQDTDLSNNQQTNEDRLICPICGYDDIFIANPFVWGQTAQEFETDVLANNASEVLMEPEPFLETTAYEYTAFPLAAGISVSIGIKGFKARHRVMKGLAWLPCNKEDAELERQEYQKMNRTICAGSWPMHEFCAHFLHFNRQLNIDRSKKLENQRIIEILSGLGRAKSTPIGIDREGTFYWIFKDSKSLYTSTGGLETLRDNICKPPIYSNTANNNNNSNNNISTNNNTCNHSEHQKQVGNRQQRWSIYSTDEEIYDIVNWLNNDIPEERILKRILKLLYPDLITITNKRNTSNVMITNNLISTNDDDLEDEQQTILVNSSHPQLDVISHTNHNITVGDDVDEDDEDEINNEQLFMNEIIIEEKTKTDMLQKKNLSHDTKKYNFNMTNNDNSIPNIGIYDIQKLSYMSDISSRPAIKYRNKLLDLYYPVINTTTTSNTTATNTISSNIPSFIYRKGEHVLVDASYHNHILWEARIIECKIAKFDSIPSLTSINNSNNNNVSKEQKEYILYYKVRFDKWSTAYDGWYEESQIISPHVTYTQHSSGKLKNTGKALAIESKTEYLKSHVWTPPEILTTLQAYQYINESNRECSNSSTSSSSNIVLDQPPPLTYSDCHHSTISKLRLALLMIEKALPIGCIDESDDRWSDNFVLSWREAVMIAIDATSLMQCQIMLEYGIKTAWLKPIGLKVFSYFPSRNHAMKTATYGMVAIRIWTLDATIKYDKVLQTNINTSLNTNIANNTSSNNIDKSKSNSKNEPIKTTKNTKSKR